MQILIYLLVGIILALGDYLIFEKHRKYLIILAKLLFYIPIFNVLSLAILKFGFKIPNIVDKSTYTMTNSLKYAGFTLLLGLIFLGVKSILVGKFNIPFFYFSKPDKKITKRGIFLNILMIIFCSIGATFVFFSDWFIGYFGNITPEQFLFNLKSPLKGTSSDMSNEILNTPLFSTIAFSVLFVFLLCFSYEIFIKIGDNKKKLLSQKFFRLSTFIISVLCLILGVKYGINKLHLDKVAKAYFNESTYIEDNYVDPRKVKMSFPAKKRNLIHIYLESVESSYLSKELGGHMNVNLMPELTELSKEGISFSNNDKFGGPHQTYGSSWSVASMINMGSGVPLKIPMNNNSYGLSGTFLPGIITIGDILEAQGYNQTIMFGADADFGGLTTYFNSHGNFNIFDYKAAIKKGLIPKDYYVWWGYEDDKLYNYAKDELTRLHKEGKPFNFTMETADTHFPDGYLSSKAEKKHDAQYANVISYSTKEAVDFVKWIQKQPFYEDTTIVITGDHLSMDKNFFTNFDPNYQRAVFNLIINSPVTTNNTKNRDFAPFDMFPTILSSMGVQIEGNRLGLGTNLFSKEKTLIEKDGLKNVEEGLGTNSNFFNDEFISEKKTSVFENTLIKQRKPEEN